MTLNPAYDVIGKGFVQQYYALFDDPAQRPQLVNMYNVDSSFMTFEGIQIQGGPKIMEKLQSLTFQKISRIITAVDSQPMFDGGVLINVLGRLQENGFQEVTPPGMAPCENISIPATDGEAPLLRGGETFFGVTPEDDVIVGGGNCSLWAGADGNCSLAASVDEVPVKLNKFQIIKAVVLAGVTIVIMISICRMVFQLFVRYNVRQDR